MTGKTLRWSCLLAAALAGLDSAACLGQTAASGDQASRFQAEMQEAPGLVRYYTFESVSLESPLAESLGREKSPLRYRGSDPLALVEGRAPGGKAVRLDTGRFEGAPFEAPQRAFTVEIWLRKHGQGVQLGNGQTNGMILCLGNGYWEGMRLSTSYPGKEVRFEIGRPQPANSVSAQWAFGLPDGVWHHLAATWERFDLADLARCDRGIAQLLGLRAPAEGVLAPGRIEGGVGDVVDAAGEMLVLKVGHGYS